MDRLIIDKNCVETLKETKFLNMFDLKYAEGKHYFEATRRKKEDIIAVKDDEEFKSLIPDAVTIAVVVYQKGEEPRLLLQYEYRYPIGRFVISPVAGLIDEEDKELENPFVVAAIREIKEETGLTVKESDEVFVINPCAFASPGMTDESNAFLCAKVYVDNLDELNQNGAVGSELFNGFELVNRQQAKELFETGRDKYGNFFSLSTWAVIGYFLMME